MAVQLGPASLENFIHPYEEPIMTRTPPAPNFAPEKLTHSTVASFLNSPQIVQQVAKALPRHMSADRILRMALTAIRKAPKILECDQTSLVACLIQASELGLELSGPLGQAYIIPRKNNGRMEATFQIGYKGYVKLAMNTGKVASFHARAVHEGDFFEYELGTRSYVKHRKIAKPGAKITHFYGVLAQKDDSFDCEVWTNADMETHRDQYRSDRALKAQEPAYRGPWDNEYEAMGAKTLIRQLAKRTLLSSELVEIATRDEFYELDTPADEYSDVHEEPENEVLTDVQLHEFNAAIVDHEAGPHLIRKLYGLHSGERLKASDFDDCMKRIKAGEFSQQ
jgi:recombination protein RecT